MHRVALRFAVVALFGSGPSAATVAPQVGPGLPDLVYDSSQLFKVIATIGGPGLHGHSILHDGYLAVFRNAPGGVELYDVSNPYRPVLAHSITAGMGDLSEPHTMAQTTAYGGKHVVVARGPGGLGGTGFVIGDWTDLSAPQAFTYDLPGVPGGYATGVFWLFYQAPYVYCGAGSLGLYVVDASDPSAPFVVKHMPTSQTGGFNAVNTIAVGNLLLVTNSDGGPGMARFDIGDPENPQLLSASTNTSIPYGIQVNGAEIIVPAVSGPVNSPTGNDGALEIRSLFGSGFPVENQAPLDARGGSAVVQDEFVHVAGSVSYVKYDVSDPSGYVEVGSTAMPHPGGDWDWGTPLGNLVALGDDQTGYTDLVVHRTLPDNTGPAVTMVVPANGAVHQPLTTRVGITLSDMIELESIDGGTFIVRRVGGPPLAGSYSHQFGIVNFTPAQELAPNGTYEVVVPAGGMRDWSGNPVPATFTSRFSTGGQITAIEVVAQPTAPNELGAPTTFDVASVTGPGPFQYSWDFGDGTPPTPFSGASQATHTYAEAGHYAALVTATNGAISGTDSFLHTVHHPLTAIRPTRSSTIVLDEARSRAWCVNADNDTVSAIDTEALEKELEVPVGAHPRTLAQGPGGALWVVCQDDATIRVLHPTSGASLFTLALPYASAPYGIAMSPDGSAAWVSLRARGEVVALDSATGALLATVPVGPDPRGIAISADSERVFVTRFLSSSPSSPSGLTPSQPPSGPAGKPTAFGKLLPVPVEPAAEVYELSASLLVHVRTIPLRLDPGPDTETSGRGLPNYLSSLAISPDGRRLWVPSKKDNIQRGEFLDGLPLTFDSTVRTIASQIDLATSRELPGARIDFNDRDLAFAAEYSPLGDYAFTVLQGSNALDVRDAFTGALVAAVEGTGLAPQGLAMTAGGTRLYVHNFMSRSVTAYDTSGVTSSTAFGVPLLAEVSTVANEKLETTVLRGKRIFYNAADPRMNEDGYISCASCHLDGEGDGRTWDFTDRGEGLRNTVSLRGKAGVGHGNVHWTANFDEIQDFENDIRDAFGGDGFMDDALFYSGTVSAPLGAPKAGLSADLDALADYVGSLGQFGLSPHRDPSGSLTAAGASGRAIFQALGCAQCHSGADFTDSASGVVHDVGTLGPGSGQASGGPLVGLDTPTLRGLWATAPYLHDGSAATLMEVITSKNPQGLHGATGALGATERSDLVAYLRQIDDLEPGPPSGP